MIFCLWKDRKIVTMIVDGCSLIMFDLAMFKPYVIAIFYNIEIKNYA